MKKKGYIALYMSVGLFSFVQLITQERFAPEASNLIGIMHIVLDE